MKKSTVVIIVLAGLMGIAAGVAGIAMKLAGHESVWLWLLIGGAALFTAAAVFFSLRKRNGKTGQKR